MPNTPKPRTTPGINQPTVNKTYKNTSNSSSYIGNLGKEFKQVGSAWKNALNEGGNYNPDGDMKAAKANANYETAKSQLLGALFQGRRYDDNTGKQIKAAPKNEKKRQGFKIP
jgi:hypothetical protein